MNAFFNNVKNTGKQVENFHCLAVLLKTLKFYFFAGNIYTKKQPK